MCDVGVLSLPITLFIDCFLVGELNWIECHFWLPHNLWNVIEFGIFFPLLLVFQWTWNFFDEDSAVWDSGWVVVSCLDRGGDQSWWILRGWWQEATKDCWTRWNGGKRVGGEGSKVVWIIGVVIVKDKGMSCKII